MKKIMILLVILGALCLIQAEEKPEIKDVEPFWYVYTEFEGNMNEMQEAINMLYQEVRNQSIQWQGALFTIIFGPSDQGEGIMRLSVGFQINKDDPVNLPLKKAEYTYTKVATITHVGPYETVGEAMNIIFPYIENNGFEQIGPMVAYWLSNREEVEPEKCRTLIIIPVKKVEG